MARKEREYKRLPGRPFSLFDVRSLWQGPDHLLWVETVFFKENYKRFFYKDIQALVMQRVNTHILWTFIWGAPALICGLLAYLLPGTSYVSGTFAVIFFLATAVNLAMGPACSVQLQTAVQIHTLTSLKRIRTARKTMARIKELVEAVQGPWERQNQPAARQSADASSAPATGAVPSVGRDGIAAVAGPFNPVLHRTLFGVLCLLGVSAFVQLQFKSLSLALVDTLLHSGAQIMVIVSLVRWHRQIRNTLIAKINWLAIVFISIQTLIGYGLYMAASFRNPMINYNHWAMFKQMFQLQSMDHPLALAANLVYAGGCLLLGCFGLLVLRRPSSSARNRRGRS